MADTEHGAGEKEYEASPRKLEQAQERGDVPRTQEAGAAVALIALTLLAFRGGPIVAQPMIDLVRELYSIEALERLDKGVSLMPIAFNAIARAVLPLVGAMCVAGLFFELAQLGFRIPSSDEAGLKFDFSRLDIISNARERYGTKALIDAGKNLLKLALVASILAWSMQGVLRNAEGFLGLEPSEMAFALSQQIGDAVMRIAAASVAIALGDYLLERFRYMRKNRMSREDMKDEAKQTEGDPMIKAARKRRGREIATKKALASVDQATVLVANPTHYSVTLRFKRGEDLAPIVLGKGVDRIALKMREKARALGVPIVENVPLARTLYAIGKEGKPIPVDLYRDVAEVLAQVLAPPEKRAAARRPARPAITGLGGRR